MVCVCGVCVCVSALNAYVMWVCQVGVSCGCVMWVCHVGVSCGCVMWVCHVGVSSAAHNHKDARKYCGMISCPVIKCFHFKVQQQRRRSMVWLPLKMAACYTAYM